jgi:hypothetical protein
MSIKMLSRRLRWEEHVERIGRKMNVYKAILGKLVRK